VPIPFPSFLEISRSLTSYVLFHLWSSLLLQYILFSKTCWLTVLYILYISLSFFEARNTSRNHVRPFKEQLPGRFGFWFTCCAMPSHGLQKHNSSLVIDSFNNSSFSDSFSNRRSPQCYRPRLFPPTPQRSFVGHRSFDAVPVESPMLSGCRHPTGLCRSRDI
jgi:hypothetical protein